MTSAKPITASSALLRRRLAGLWGRTPFASLPLTVLARTVVRAKHYGEPFHGALTKTQPEYATKRHPRVTAVRTWRKMSGHIYVVVSGFGQRIIPAVAPYRVARDRERIRVDVQFSETWRSAFYDSTTVTSDDVADIIAGPDWNDWWLETTQYRVPFPDGWTAHVSATWIPSCTISCRPRKPNVEERPARPAPPTDYDIFSRR